MNQITTFAIHINGFYVEDSSQLSNNRPVYRKEGSPEFFLYSADGDGLDYWVISNRVGEVSTINAYTLDDSMDADNLNGIWYIWSPFLSIAKEVHGFQVECAPEDFIECHSGMLELSAQMDLPLGNLALQRLMGTYILQEDSMSYGRPVYKHESLHFYLYYTLDQDSGDGYWAVGTNPGSVSFWWVVVISNAPRPEFIHNGEWNFKNTVSVGAVSGIAQPVNNMEIRCKGKCGITVKLLIAACH